jgi:hypothetical protein
VVIYLLRNLGHQGKEFEVVKVSVGHGREV